MPKVILKLLVCCLMSSCHVQTKSDFDCNQFLNYGGSEDKIRQSLKSNPQELAWNWFVCLNNASAENKMVRVWETFKPTDQVFLANGEKPQPYAQRTATPADVLAEAKKMNMETNRVFHNLDSILQVDGLILEMGGAVPSAQRGLPVRYELLMTQDTFAYIVDKKVYNVNGQAALTADLSFPATAWEIKTSWLWIGGDSDYLGSLEKDGYYIAQAYYLENGVYQVGYAALTGMHVINRLEKNWVWTTFENKSNSKYTVTNDIPAKPMTNETGPTAAAKVANTTFQSRYPDLAQYELIGIQYQAGQEPILLASSQMESSFQSQSSCMACHSTAAYSVDDGYFNFAQKKQGGIVYPTALLPDSDYKGYSRLDFAWSLKRAQWKR